MVDKDYYKILGVEPSDSDEVIKKAYRKLAVEHHPDKGGNSDRFKEISEAYSVLSDDSKRKEYDFTRNGGGMFGNISDIFGFGGGMPFNFQQRPDPNRPMRGRDIRYGIEVPIHYFIFGGNLTFDISYEDICTSCGGTGALKSSTCTSCGGAGQMASSTMDNGMFMMRSTPCLACSGRGFTIDIKCSECQNGTVVKNKSIDVTVPKGVGEGHVIVKEGFGLSGRNKGPNGNLFVKLGIRLPKAEELTLDQIKVLKTL
jgi:molecular chaperone DnaJ